MGKKSVRVRRKSVEAIPFLGHSPALRACWRPLMFAPTDKTQPTVLEGRATSSLEWSKWFLEE